MTCRTRLMLQPSEMYMILGGWNKDPGCFAGISEGEVFDFAQQTTQDPQACKLLQLGNSCSIFEEQTRLEDPVGRKKP